MLSSIDLFINHMIVDVQNTIVTTADGEAKKLGEFSENVIDSLIGKGGGSLVIGLEWLCKVLNSEDLEIWSRAWGANNNVNNYEIESLPFPVPEDELAFSI